MKNKHRGLFSLYNTGIAVFFTIGIILVIIFVNIGFAVNDAQKTVVDDAVDEIDERLVIAGRISAAADISTNEIMITATPVKTASDGSVNVSPEIMKISYKLVQPKNDIINYENIYAGILTDKSYNSLREAIVDAKNQGLIVSNPFVDEQKPSSTTAFVYWVTNENFDHRIDNNELAVLAIVYAEKDRPASGEQLTIKADIPEGNVLIMEQDVPNVSSAILNFGGTINGL